jgi:hypothetical protein
MRFFSMGSMPSAIWPSNTWAFLRAFSTGSASLYLPNVILLTLLPMIFSTTKLFTPLDVTRNANPFKISSRKKI